MNLRRWVNGLKKAGSSDPEAEVAALFEAEFVRRGLPIPVRGSDGRYEFEQGEGEYQFSLQNLVRQFERDRDASAVVRCVDNVLEMAAPLPPWQEARKGLRFSAEPKDHDFGDTLRTEVSDRLCRVLVYENSSQTRIRWLSPDDLAEWQVTEDDLKEAASANMAALLRQTHVEVELAHGFRLAMLSTHSAFKASLIFSPNLREVAAPKLGWPLYAVIPCRDFAFLFDDPELTGMLGAIVVQEFTQGAYPISTEVYRIDDEGIEAIGEFPVPEA